MENSTIEKVTSVTPKITATINALLLQLNPASKQLTDEDLIDLVAQSSTHLFVAKTASMDIVGMVTFVVYRIPFVKKGVLEDFVIDEALRGKGVGKKLIMHAKSFAKEQGVTYIDLTSNPKRTDANAFYQHLGFVKRETNVYRISL